MAENGHPPKKGRGFPPAEHQWAKGVSGNPFGRPPGSKNKKSKADLTAAERITVEEGTRLVKTSDGELEVLRGVERAQGVSAILGGSNAQKDFMKRNAQTQRRMLEQEEAASKEWRGFLAKLEQSKQQFERWRRKVTPFEVEDADFLPHPDDWEVDFENEALIITGPTSLYQRKQWEAMLERLGGLKALVEQLRRKLEVSPLDEDLTVELIVTHNVFDEVNNKLSPRYRLERVPIWQRAKELPMPLSMR